MLHEVEAIEALLFSLLSPEGKMGKLEEIFSKYAESHAREVPARVSPGTGNKQGKNAEKQENAR